MVRGLVNLYCNAADWNLSVRQSDDIGNIIYIAIWSPSHHGWPRRWPKLVFPSKNCKSEGLLQWSVLEWSTCYARLWWTWWWWWWACLSCLGQLDGLRLEWNGTEKVFWFSIWGNLVIICNIWLPDKNPDFEPWYYISLQLLISMRRFKRNGEQNVPNRRPDMYKFNFLVGLQLPNKKVIKRG